MNKFNVYFTLSNGAQLADSIETKHPSTALEEYMRLPKFLKFLADNPRATITDKRVEYGWYYAPNNKFMLTSFYRLDGHIAATEIATGVTIKFKKHRYEKSVEIWDKPEGMTDDEAQQSADNIEQWLKTNFRELVYTANELYKMKQLEKAAREVGEDYDPYNRIDGNY